MFKERPSQTAYKVALNIITLGAKPGMEDVLPPGIVEATEALLVASGAGNETMVRWSKTRKMVAVYEWFDGMLPNQFEAFAHRKAFCERQIRGGIQSGARQILVLGAGYDTAGWRIAPEFPDVRFFEIDHPATSRYKRKGISAMGDRDNLRLISADLGEQRLVDVLEAEHSWDPGADAVIVAEGLLMYLEPAAVSDLFFQSAAVSGRGSRIVFTFIGQDAEGRPDAGPWTGFVRWTLNLTGEPWRWTIRPEALDVFLEETGWVHTPALVGQIGKRGVEFFGAALKDLG
jgi:methyltransferase (TIGR00027 family)